MPRHKIRRHLRVVSDVMPLPIEFERFLQYLTRNERQAAATIAARRIALRNFVTYCETMRVVNPVHAGEDILLAWQANLALSDGTVANYSQGVSRCFRWLASKSGGRVLEEDPTAELPAVRVLTPQLDAIADDDLYLALVAAEPNPRLLTWLLLEAGTGIRPVQIASLTRQRVRYDGARAALTVSGKGADLVVLAGPDIAAGIVETGSLPRDVVEDQVRPGLPVRWIAGAHTLIVCCRGGARTCARRRQRTGDRNVCALPSSTLKRGDDRRTTAVTPGRSRRMPAAVRRRLLLGAGCSYRGTTLADLADGTLVPAALMATTSNR